MTKRLSESGSGVVARQRAVLFLALAGAALGALSSALAQGSLLDAPNPTRAVRPPTLPGQLPDKPSQPPAFKVPVEPLGFSAPGPLYLGQRNSLVSLDFLDEDRLLFTFRVPGLIRRGPGEREASQGEMDARQIRAVVLALPSGAVQAEALWTVHDRQRYLWMLAGGRFLLRDRDNLEMGDATLELKPFLRFPGPLLWLDMDPAQKFLVTNSREPAASADKEPEGEKPASSELAVRVLRRDSGQVMLVSRTPSTVHLPINSDGYLGSLRASSDAWMLNLNYFSGGSRILGRVDSTCSPLFDFLSDREVLATTCTDSGAGKLVAMTTDGRRLWEAQTSDESIWPMVVRSPDGSRLAREALAITHPVSAREPVSQDDIKGQLVEILDAADGKVALQTQASPILDAGGNVAISPSGRRVAVVNGGAIQIFELPPPPPLPDLTANPPVR
ncbi:MAG: hypothetical protein WAK26_19460 [Terracidiphilus sp.]